jgi:hypothetical protein
MRFVEVCYIRSNHPDQYRSGQWAKITGVYWVAPDVKTPFKPCYCVEFIDGKRDYWAIDDPAAAYHFSSNPGSF